MTEKMETLVTALEIVAFMAIAAALYFGGVALWRAARRYRRRRR